MDRISGDGEKRKELWWSHSIDPSAWGHLGVDACFFLSLFPSLLLQISFMDILHGYMACFEAFAGLVTNKNGISFSS